MPDPLETLAERATRQPEFLAFLLAAYARDEDLDDAGLMQRLGCDRSTLTRLRLCGLPRPAPHQDSDLQRIAQRFGIDPAVLARILKHARVITRIANASAAPTLLAARDAEAEPDHGTP